MTLSLGRIRYEAGVTGSAVHEAQVSLEGSVSAASFIPLTGTSPVPRSPLTGTRSFVGEADPKTVGPCGSTVALAWSAARKVQWEVVGGRSLSLPRYTVPMGLGTILSLFLSLNTHRRAGGSQDA